MKRNRGRSLKVNKKWSQEQVDNLIKHYKEQGFSNSGLIYTIPSVKILEVLHKMG